MINEKWDKLRQRGFVFEMAIFLTYFLFMETVTRERAGFIREPSFIIWKAFVFTNFPGSWLKSLFSSSTRYTIFTLIVKVGPEVDIWTPFTNAFSISEGSIIFILITPWWKCRAMDGGGKKSLWFSVSSQMRAITLLKLEQEPHGYTKVLNMCEKCCNHEVLSRRPCQYLLIFIVIRSLENQTYKTYTLSDGSTTCKWLLWCSPWKGIDSYRICRSNWLTSNKPWKKLLFNL